MDEQTRDSARTSRSKRVREARAPGPGLLDRLPGMAYQSRNDPFWTLEFVSAGARDLTGYEPAELLAGRPDNDVPTYVELIHPDDRRSVWHDIQEAVEEDRAFELEYRIRTRSGRLKWVWERGYAVRDTRGELLILEGFVTDVSSRRRSTLRLRRSMEMLRTLVDQDMFGVYVIQEGAFRLVNDAFARIFGYGRSELRGMAPQDLVADEDRERVEENLRRRAEGEAETVQYGFTGLRKDGTTVSVEVHGSRGHLHGEPALTGVLLDVTEREELAAQLRQTQKREALAELTGAVAHDFNNFLTGIMGSLDLARMDLEGAELGPDPVKRDVEENLRLARSVAERGAGLARQLLRFSRKGVDRPRTFDLNEVVEGMSSLLQQLVGSPVRLEVDPSREPLPVRLDPGHMEQVLMNLVLNARDAMPEGGIVEVRTRMGAVDGGQALRVILEVRDTGHGMDAETRARVFSPFFTTKATGTGLGLATVRRIVEDAGGDVELESEPERGSLFRIHLPAAEGALEKPRSAPPGRGSPPPAQPKTRTLVLVVEDDDAVRSLMQSALVRHGYRVDAVRTAEAALGRLDAPDSAPDVLLTDVSLPDRPGTDVATRFRELHPGRGVILASGYTPEEWGGDQALLEQSAFLEKPFAIEELLEAVRQAVAVDETTDGSTGGGGEISEAG